LNLIRCLNFQTKKETQSSLYYEMDIPEGQSDVIEIIRGGNNKISISVIGIENYNDLSKNVSAELQRDGN